MDPLSQSHQKTNSIKQREGTAETPIDVPRTNKDHKIHKNPQTQTNTPSNVKGFDAIKGQMNGIWQSYSNTLQMNTWQWLYLLFVTIYPYSSLYLV